MGLRESFNANPAVTATATSVIIVGALLVVMRRGCADSEPSAAAPRQQHATVDDGRTWFAAADHLVPPFQHEGKTAYRAKVYRCADGREFVSHLERYAEADRKQVQDAIDHARATDSGTPPGEGLFPHAMEVKRPGEKDWVRWSPKTSQTYNAITTPKCPDGSTQGIQPVLPG